MQEPAIAMPSPKAKAPTASTQLTGPMCAPGGRRVLTGSQESAEHGVIGESADGERGEDAGIGRARRGFR